MAKKNNRKNKIKRNSKNESNGKITPLDNAISQINQPHTEHKPNKKKGNVLKWIYYFFSIITVIYTLATIPDFISDFFRKRSEKKELVNLENERKYLNTIVDTLKAYNHSQKSLYKYVKQLESKVGFEDEFNYYYGCYLFSFYYRDQTTIGDPEEYWKKITLDSDLRHASFFMRFVKYYTILKNRRISDRSYLSYKFLDIAEEYHKEKSKDHLYYLIYLHYQKTNDKIGITDLYNTYISFMNEVNLPYGLDKSGPRLTSENDLKDSIIMNESTSQYFKYNTLKYYYSTSILEMKPKNNEDMKIQNDLKDYFKKDYFYLNMLKSGEILNFIFTITFGFILDPDEYTKEMEKLGPIDEIPFTLWAEYPAE